MPGGVVHVGAAVMCAHGGQAQPTVPNLRVLVSAQPTTAVAPPWMVAGCAFNVSGVPSPCLTATWITSATRVTSNGQPLLLLDSQALCAPNGTPLMVASAQTRVTAI